MVKKQKSGKRVNNNSKDSSEPPKPFPWNRLPQELQVMILAYLPRPDLNKCRTLNRETFSIIRANERQMRRKQISLIEFKGRRNPTKVTLRYDCPEEGKVSNWTKLLDDVMNEEEPDIPTTLLDRFADKIKDGHINQLVISRLKLTDNTLSLLSSCLRKSQCQVFDLSLLDLSVGDVTPSALIRFICDLAPTNVEINFIKDCSSEHFGPELCSFLISRHFFTVSGLYDGYSEAVPLSMDDDLLGRLTADDFFICAPNLITHEGLKSFTMRSVKNGFSKPLRGIIEVTYPINHGISWLKSLPNVEVTIKNDSVVEIAMSYKP
ncbi:hypothetical protein GCK32_004799 [Trichostrongylus colubriformis]|uniref:F-box domain-containing protein n=1 Tax=Trichostrongylus colubriformis TaxID=6319 RepID=A0AAN8FPQ6_TRICO